MRFLFTLLFAGTLSCLAQNPPTFSISSPSQYSITCASPQAIVQVSSSISHTVSWTGANFSATGDSVSIASPGSYTLSVASGTVVTLVPLIIGIDTVAPVCTASSTIIVLGASTPQSLTFTAISPTVNITQTVYAPGQLPLVMPGKTMIYAPDGPGTYTHCIRNDISGCTSCINFIVSNTATAIKKNILHNGISFPNPNNGLFDVSLNRASVTSLEVYDLHGSLITRQQTEKEKLQLNISSQPDGIYLLKVSERDSPGYFLRLIKASGY